MSSIVRLVLVIRTCESHLSLALDIIIKADSELHVTVTIVRHELKENVSRFDIS